MVLSAASNMRSASLNTSTCYQESRFAASAEPICDLSRTGVSSYSYSATGIRLCDSNTPRLCMRSWHDSHSLTPPHCKHTTDASSALHRSHITTSSSDWLASDLSLSTPDSARDDANGLRSDARRYLSKLVPSSPPSSDFF